MFPEMNLFNSKESLKTAMQRWQKQLKRRWWWGLYLVVGNGLCVLLGFYVWWRLQVMLPLWASVLVGVATYLLLLFE